MATDAPCPECAGEGRIRDLDTDAMTYECPACFGTGLAPGSAALAEHLLTEDDEPRAARLPLIAMHHTAIVGKTERGPAGPPHVVVGVDDLARTELHGEWVPDPKPEPTVEEAHELLVEDEGLTLAEIREAIDTLKANSVPQPTQVVMHPKALAQLRRIGIEPDALATLPSLPTACGQAPSGAPDRPRQTPRQRGRHTGGRRGRKRGRGRG